MWFALWFFGSGLAFWAGCVLLGIASLLRCRYQGQWFRLAAPQLGWLGFGMIWLFSAPFPVWFQAILWLLVVAHLMFEEYTRVRQSRWLWWSRRLAWTLLLIAAVWEGLYWPLPTLPAQGRPTLGIIGDSITAGLGDERFPLWPELLERDHQLQVIDLAEPGATVKSALEQAGQLPDTVQLLVLEIGGNDVLGSTTVAEFEAGLERLLQQVCRPGRTVVMFEVPLPPLCQRFGVVQRRLARRHGVPLIPKWVLISILAPAANTVDSIHLTAAGQQALARAVWKSLAPAYQSER